MKKIRIMMIFVILSFVIFNGIVYYFSVDVKANNERLTDDIAEYNQICKDNEMYNLLISDGDIINSNNQELIDKKQSLIGKMNELSTEIDRLTLEIEKLS